MINKKICSYAFAYIAVLGATMPLHTYVIETPSSVHEDKKLVPLFLKEHENALNEMRNEIMKSEHLIADELEDLALGVPFVLDNRVTSFSPSDCRSDYAGYRRDMSSKLVQVFIDDVRAVVGCILSPDLAPARPYQLEFAVQRARTAAICDILERHVRAVGFSALYLGCALKNLDAQSIPFIRYASHRPIQVGYRSTQGARDLFAKKYTDDDIELLVLEYEHAVNSIKTVDDLVAVCRALPRLLDVLHNIRLNHMGHGLLY